MIALHSLKTEEAPRKQHWLLPELLPGSELVLLDGAPGVGKTMFLANFASAYSCSIPPGESDMILVLTSKEHRPAFQSFLARHYPNYNNVKGIEFPFTLVPSPSDGGGSGRGHSFALEMIAFLEGLFTQQRIRMLIIDSLEELISPELSNNPRELALLWRTLRSLARDHLCSIIVTRRHGYHESRSYGPYTRHGSEIAPVALTMHWHPTDPDMRVITLAKNQYGPIGFQTHLTFRPQGHCYTSYTDIHEHVRPSHRPATWHPVSHADEVDKEIIEFVEVMLDGTPQCTIHIQNLVTKAGFSVNAFRRAMGKAKLKKIRNGNDICYDPSEKMRIRHILKMQQNDPNHNEPQNDPSLGNITGVDDSSPPAENTEPEPIIHTLEITPKIQARTATPQGCTLPGGPSGSSPYY